VRLIAYHDSEGNIVSLAASQPDSVPVQAQLLEASPGLRRTEVEAPTDVTFEADSPQQLFENMDKLIDNYRVEMPEAAGQGSLRRKADAAAGQSSSY
jgi:hypothetical protein